MIHYQKVVLFVYFLYWIPQIWVTYLTLELPRTPQFGPAGMTTTCFSIYLYNTWNQPCDQTGTSIRVFTGVIRRPSSGKSGHELISAITRLVSLLCYRRYSKLVSDFCWPLSPESQLHALQSRHRATVASQATQR